MVSRLRGNDYAGIAHSTRGRIALADVHPPASRSCPGDRADHVQGGGSFPRAVWMARTIMEVGAPVNTWKRCRDHVELRAGGLRAARRHRRKAANHSASRPPPGSVRMAVQAAVVALGALLLVLAGGGSLHTIDDALLGGGAIRPSALQLPYRATVVADHRTAGRAGAQRAGTRLMSNREGARWTPAGLRFRIDENDAGQCRGNRSKHRESGRLHESRAPVWGCSERRQ